LVGSSYEQIPLTILLPVSACVFLFGLFTVVVIVIVCRHCYVTRSSNVDDVTTPDAVACCCEYEWRGEWWLLLDRPVCVSVADFVGGGGELPRAPSDGAP